MFMVTSDDGEPSKCGRNHKSKVGLDPGGSFRETLLGHRGGMLEAGHAGFHPAEAELAVEVLLAGRGVEDHIAARKAVQDGLHDAGADALPLAFRHDGHFVDGRLVGAVGNRPAEADRLAVRIGEHDDRAGRERFPQQFRRPRGHAYAPERLGHERPIHDRAIEFQFHVHRLWCTGTAPTVMAFSSFSGFSCLGAENPGNGLKLRFGARTTGAVSP